jgi:tRNA-binding EMAP/Myf-like protein
MNFAAKRVAGVKSEVLVLGATSDQLSTKLVFVDAPVELGSRIS